MRAGGHRRRRALLLCMLLAVIDVAKPCPAADAKSCLDSGVQPSYPPLNAPPIVQTTNQDAGGSVSLSGTGCFGKQDKAALWVTVASLLQTSLSQRELVERFGAISHLREVQYWSTTDQEWRPMVSVAFAVEVADAGQPRADYSAAELGTGIYRYYRVNDTRLGHVIGYRLQVRQLSPGRVIVDTANVEPIKKWGMTLYEPEGVSTLYFLREQSSGIWSYYSITRVLPATLLAAGHENSYINRAVALFRHYMQLPSVSDSPPAR